MERWSRMAQTAPWTLKVYALLTAIGFTLYSVLSTRPHNYLFDVALVGAIVITVLIRSQRGWGAGVFLAGACAIYGLAQWTTSEGVVLAVYGVLASVLLMSRVTLRWVKPFEPRSMVESDLDQA